MSLMSISLKQEAMDTYLSKLELWRKPLPKDGSCLFRAVAEQLFNTQHFHRDVRAECIKFMKSDRPFFEQFMDMDFDDYVNKLKEETMWGGNVEMKALSAMYQVDFIIYQEAEQPPQNATDNGYTSKILLCYSGGSHFDSVYRVEYVATMAMCQGLVYEVLYKDVYQMGSLVDQAVNSMLYDKAYSKLHRNRLNQAMAKRPEVREIEERASTQEELYQALARGIPPFPYKVAKALDVNIYRNVELDMWNETVKESELAQSQVIPKFEPGAKCLLKLDPEQKHFYCGHIQKMAPDKGPVTIYVVDLAEMCTVPYENLEPIPLVPYKKKKNKIRRIAQHRAPANNCFSPQSRLCQTNFKFSKKTSFSAIQEHPVTSPMLLPGSPPSGTFALLPAPTAGTGSDQEDAVRLGSMVVPPGFYDAATVAQVAAYSTAAPIGMTCWVPQPGSYFTAECDAAALTQQTIPAFSPGGGENFSQYYINMGYDYLRVSTWNVPLNSQASYISPVSNPAWCPPSCPQCAPAAYRMLSSQLGPRDEEMLGMTAPSAPLNGYTQCPINSPLM